MEGWTEIVVMILLMVVLLVIRDLPKIIKTAERITRDLTKPQESSKPMSKYSPLRI